MSQLSRIAIRNVTRNKRRSVITLAAVFLGVALVGSLKGFSNGFVDLLIRNAVEGQTGALQIHRAGYLENLDGAPLELSMPESPELVGKIRSVPGVKAVTGRIQFTGLISNGLSQTMFAARALDLGSEKTVVPRSGFDVLPGGRALQPGDFRDVLVGGELAQSLHAMPTPEKEKAKAHAQVVDGIPPTDMLTLQSTSPEGRANSLSVRVEGTLSSGMAFQAKQFITVPLALAQDLLNMKGKVTEYAVAVDDLNQLDRIVGDLRRVLGPEYEVTTWYDLNPTARDGIKRMQFMLGMISTVLLIIVLTGIINTLLMSVYERVREIGTMLAVGVRRGQILGLFLLEALTLGGLGGLCGAIVARGIVGWLHQRGIPIPGTGSTPDLVLPSLSLTYLAGAVVLAAVAAMVAALYPAWKASRLNPVDALRSV